MEVYINMHLKNATVKTSFEKLSRTLIQPFGITIETDIQLYSDIDEDVTTPRSVVTLTTGLLSVLIGQEHIMCFDKILKELAALVPVSIFFFLGKPPFQRERYSGLYLFFYPMKFKSNVSQEL